MLERERYEAWLKASQGYFAQTLRAYESNPIWTDDPKNTPFRDGPSMTLHPGYAGKEGAASAAAVADFVVVNMVAEAATGQIQPAGRCRTGRGAGTAVLQDLNLLGSASGAAARYPADAAATSGAPPSTPSPLAGEGGERGNVARTTESVVTAHQVW